MDATHNIKLLIVAAAVAALLLAVLAVSSEASANAHRHAGTVAAAPHEHAWELV